MQSRPEFHGRRHPDTEDLDGYLTTFKSDSPPPPPHPRRRSISLERRRRRRPFPFHHHHRHRDDTTTTSTRSRTIVRSRSPRLYRHDHSSTHHHHYSDHRRHHHHHYDYDYSPPPPLSRGDGLLASSSSTTTTTTTTDAADKFQFIRRPTAALHTTDPQTTTHSYSLPSYDVPRVTASHFNQTTSPTPLPYSTYHTHMDPYREGTFTPPTTAHPDSFPLQHHYLYPSHQNMNLHHTLELDYDMLRPRLLNPVTRRPQPSDIAHSTEKRASAQYLDTLPIHSRLGRKVSGEDEMGMAPDHEIERARLDYDYKRDLSSGSHKERVTSFQGFLSEREDTRMVEHHLSPYDSSSRYLLKRRYTMEDEENRIPSTSVTSRLDTVNTRHSHDSRDEEWIDQDGRRSDYSRRTHKVYDDDEFIYAPDKSTHDYDHHMQSNEYDDKYVKGFSRSNGRGGYSSYQSNRRNVLTRWKNEQIIGEDNKDANMLSSEVERYEPHEDTEEFKQLVNDYFLSFTKKLNENSVVRRRYVEQGRAGSLFCSVCGRSLSKEFLDTQRLAMHAFMSRKGGLRAQHLGLLKAICVMLGWSSIIPSDTPRWFPDTLSTTEALVQKEDLIIWPPVVIVHNISILNNNSNGEGPTTVEALGQFLRGIGSSGGKVKLGKPANCSIMLVKFLGTFSALQDAEKIHEYFLKKKHGRKQLEQMTSGKGKSKREESADERVLFGYMGIAEDLDKVDIDTKRRCSIKSKKEIQDIADAPVKPGE